MEGAASCVVFRATAESAFGLRVPVSCAEATSISAPSISAQIAGSAWLRHVRIMRNYT
jgi:hypothetical protein